MAAGRDDHQSLTLVDLVERACVAHPREIAATGVDGPVTYEALWRRSGAIAAELVARSVAPDDRVGVWASQSSELLVGVLGILRAGAAFVPLEPTLPEGRLEVIVKDADIRTIVAPDGRRAAAASIVDDVCGSTDPPKQPGDVVLPTVRPDHAAYVIYTSGSTGRPKGVVVEHRSVVRLLGWLRDECDVAPGDRFIGTASPAFDASIPILLFPVVSGGTFVAIEGETARDPHLLARELEATRPTVLLTSPSMLRMLTETSWAGNGELVVWTGGERTPPEVIAYVAPRVAALCNWYGPTETTVQVAMARLAPSDVDSPIGTSPEYTSCVLLDAERRPPAPGEPGEIYVTGESLARGYLNDPALTAERFVTIELDGTGPVRAYRTGDLARRRDDGSLIILGRVDEQLNVRGYRIEPREIEACFLVRHDVLEAVVVATEAESEQDRQLVAYVKASEGTTSAQLRDAARDVLPAHMVPLVVLVDAYPMTASGKIDRRRLADDAVMSGAPVARGAGEDPSLATATELERTILQTFANVLTVDASTIGLDDDFFDLGGTSLRSLRLFMQIEEQLGVRLSLSTLTTASTPRHVADAVVTEQRRLSVRPVKGEPPRHEWERILSSIWRDVLGVAEFARTDSFFDLGGTPADANRALEQLRALYGVHVTFDEFKASPTVMDIAGLVGRRTVRSVLVPLTTTGTATPLFLIAGAGGLAVTFLPLARLLGQDQPVYGLQARGIEQRAVPDLTYRQIATRYARAIREVQPRGPYLLGGHSLGGIHALQVAQRLRADGETVALLAIFDTHLTRRMVGNRALATEPEEARRILEGAPRGLPRLSTVLRLPLVGIVPFEGTLQFDVFAALGEIQAALAGRQAPWSGRTVVFCSDDDEATSIESRWARLLTGPWHSARVPGGHIAMLEQANIATAAAVLRDELRALETTTGSHS